MNAIHQEFSVIVFTGGGSAGHVVPNLAVIEALPAEVTVHYIGAANSIEQQLVQAESIPFHAIACGKLRRYFSWQNFIDPFKVFAGMVQAFFILKKLKPNIIFSKGGFVGFPVVVAARLLKIPVICHESDASLGLANKLSLPFVNAICVGFEHVKNALAHKNKKIIVTGNPLRANLIKGNKARGKALCNFNNNKPVLLLFAGGSGSVLLNTVLRESLDELLKQFNIIHICGNNNINNNVSQNGYAQFEYVNQEFADCMAAADIVISRSGANTVYELLALQKPNILIPLSKKHSRGDQIDNANAFKMQQVSIVIEEEQLNSVLLLKTVSELLDELPAYQSRLSTLNIKNGAPEIASLLLNFKE